MSIAKHERQFKRQMGQFLTPPSLARQLVADMDFNRNDKVLEPSMGDGSFIIPLLEKFMKFYRGDVKAKLTSALSNNIYGVELDKSLYDKCLSNIYQKWGFLPESHNFVCDDFLTTYFHNHDGTPIAFDHIIGNPPFGGTINAAEQDNLDKQFGYRGGLKIKKETYSFFIVKSIDMLHRMGTLTFICSDTFLTIKTMKGLRKLLLSSGDVQVNNISSFSEEVSQQTVLLKCSKGQSSQVRVDNCVVTEEDICATPNYSWLINADTAKYFYGKKIGDLMTATSGMTVGKNEYFVRKIVNGEITEPFKFDFWQKPITLADAIASARLGHLSEKQQHAIREQENRGETTRAVRVVSRKNPIKITIPHADYYPYNKASKGIVYAPVENVIFWKDNGDAVYTYKANGNWYLRGVGGKKYFRREGITWNLVASRLWLRYLPPECILDSGAPCAFLNPGIAKDEMYFILGWGLTDMCNKILKGIINHTKNIQGKDFERLPYPFWVDDIDKSVAIKLVKEMIKDGKAGQTITPADNRIRRLNAIFSNDEYFRRGEHSHYKKHIYEIQGNLLLK